MPVIPLEGDYEIRIAASNIHVDKAWHYVANLLPLNSDGTLDPRENFAAMFVEPLRTTEARVPSLSRPGLLEISAAPQLGFTATLFPAAAAATKSSADKVGIPLPLITSSEVRKANEWILLQGLQRSANGTVTDVGVVNLGHAAVRCTAWVMGADGEPLGASALLDLRPLTMAYFTDVIGLFQHASAVDVMVRLLCDQSAYAFTVVKNGASGSIKVRGPAARGDSLLRLPGESPPDEPPADDQPAPPAGTVVFTRPGVFHTSTPSNPTGLYDMHVGAHRTFSRIRVTFDYFHGSWFPGRESWEHNLFWLHRGGTGANFVGWYGHIYGYGNVHGPNQNRMRNIWSVDFMTGLFAKHSSAVVQVGRTYRVEYIYDGVAGGWLYTLTDRATGEPVGELAGSSPAPVRTEGTGFFFLYFGHGEDDCSECPEVPNYNSVWSDLRVEFIP